MFYLKLSSYFYCNFLIIEVCFIKFLIKLIVSNCSFLIKINFIAICQFLNTSIYIIVIEHIIITIFIVVNNYFTNIINLLEFSSKILNIKNFFKNQSIYL